MQIYGNGNELFGSDPIETVEDTRHKETPSKTMHPSFSMGEFRFVNEWDHIRPDKVPGF